MPFCNTEDRFVPLRVFVMFRRLRVWMQDLAQLAQVHFELFRVLRLAKPSTSCRSSLLRSSWKFGAKDVKPGSATRSTTADVPMSRKIRCAAKERWSHLNLFACAG